LADCKLAHYDVDRVDHLLHVWQRGVLVDWVEADVDVFADDELRRRQEVIPSLGDAGYFGDDGLTKTAGAIVFVKDDEAAGFFKRFDYRLIVAWNDRP